jgi:PKHD-type hydroxylase
MMPIVPEAVPAEAAAVFTTVFSASELDTLEKQAAQAREPGGTGGERDALRRSNVRWLNFEPANIWVYQRLASLVATANAKHFRFDLTGLGEAAQLARYEASNEGHYDWHQDFGTPISRKLSITVQLSDPSTYEGGDLQIFRVAGNEQSAPRERGTAIVFPAYQLHRVTPVTRGARHSLVAWVSGPAFR